jgi:large subunit ribosomal protein L22
MAQYNYAFQGFNKELMARGVVRESGVSVKQGIEIANYLRHRKLANAKATLERVIEKKQAIPFKRFMNGLGHRAGDMASGRYPVNASKIILKLLESVEANAQTKGLNTGELELIHRCVHKAARARHQGRSGGREFKRSHIEVVVQETPKTEKGKAPGKAPAEKQKKKE